jgi:hypothetical protein
VAGVGLVEAGPGVEWHSRGGQRTAGQGWRPETPLWVHTGTPRHTHAHTGTHTSTHTGTQHTSSCERRQQSRLYVDGQPASSSVGKAGGRHTHTRTRRHASTLAISMAAREDSGRVYVCDVHSQCTHSKHAPKLTGVRNRRAARLGVARGVPSRLACEQAAATVATTTPSLLLRARTTKSVSETNKLEQRVRVIVLPHPSLRPAPLPPRNMLTHAPVAWPPWSGAPCPAPPSG